MFNTSNNIHLIFYILSYPVLYLFSKLFHTILFVRHQLYNLGILKSYHFDEVVTICVGNLNFGGSGKTPLTNYLIELLKEKYKIAVLSRGYGRKTKGFRLVKIDDVYENCGDEPLMYKLKHPDLTVAVCENRIKGVKELLNIFPDLQVIILDDAFQHRRIKADLNILISEFQYPFFKDNLFPLGKLRDLKSRARAADMLVISKTPENANPGDQEKMLKNIQKYFHKDIYFSTIEYHDMYSLNATTRINPYKDLSQYNCILITGIANPEPLATFIKEYAHYFFHFKFPDHHAFNEQELEIIRSVYVEWQKKHPTILITTEKDAMRLNSFIHKHFNLPIFIAPIRINFISSSQNFNQKILDYVRTNSKNNALHS